MDDKVGVFFYIIFQKLGTFHTVSTSSHHSFFHLTEGRGDFSCQQLHLEKDLCLHYTLLAQVLRDGGWNGWQEGDRVDFLSVICLPTHQIAGQPIWQIYINCTMFLCQYEPNLWGFFPRFYSTKNSWRENRSNWMQEWPGSVHFFGLFFVYFCSTTKKKKKSKCWSSKPITHLNSQHKVP